MFGKKKQKPQIDKEQLELIENAQRRIKQKKRLGTHFILFLIGSIFVILAYTVLGIGKEYTFAGIEWFAFVIIIWSFFLIYHTVKVYVLNPFMGKEWEQKQMNKLVGKQQDRIEKLKQNLIKEEQKIAESQVFLESQKESTGLTLIAAAGEDNALGKDNDLIWHLSDDLKRFKRLTNGHHIIMGRKTFESFPKPLPNRTHIVISRNSNYEVPAGVLVAGNIEEAIDLAKQDEQPFIIGGGEIYKQSLPYVKRIELTRVHATFNNADTFFPEINNNEWQEIETSRHEADDSHKHAFSFITYIRK